MDAALLAQIAVNGLVTGMIYALLAMGLSLIFGVLEIVNFAHGEFYMLGALGVALAVGGFGAPYWLAALLSVAGATLVGMLAFELVLARRGRPDFEHSLLLTLGVSLVLQNGALGLFTATPRDVETAFSFATLRLGAVAIPQSRLVAGGLCVAGFVVLALVLHATRTGRQMRGLAQNREAALMVGVRVGRVARCAVALGVALSGLAGAALAPVYSVHPTMGVALVFKAFAIVIIGGFGSVAGAGVAALGLGLVESAAGGFFAAAVQDAIGFVAMILVLLLRPQGLFGRGVRV